MTEWNIKKKKKKKKRARVHRKRSGAHAEACGLCEVQEKHTQTHLVLFTECLTLEGLEELAISYIR